MKDSIDGKLGHALNNSLNASMKDLGIDTADVVIENVLSFTGLASIPIFSLVRNLCEVGLSIRDRNFLKNTIAFLNQLNSGLISESEIEKHINMLNQNDKAKQIEMDYLLLYLDRYTCVRKAEILANLYSNYIRGYMELGDLDYYASILNLFNVYDEFYLKNIYECNLQIIKCKGWSDSSISRLKAMGLIAIYDKSVNKVLNGKKSLGVLSMDGLNLYELGMVGILKHLKTKPFYWL